MTQEHKRDTITFETDSIETVSGPVIVKTGVIPVSFLLRWASLPEGDISLMVEDLRIEYDGQTLDLTPEEYDRYVGSVITGIYTECARSSLQETTRTALADGLSVEDSLQANIERFFPATSITSVLSTETASEGDESERLLPGFRVTLFNGGFDA